QEQLQDELARGRGDRRQARLRRGRSAGRAVQGGLLLRIGGKAGVRLHSRVPRQDLSEPSVFVGHLHGRRQGCRAPRLNADTAPATVEEREAEPLIRRWSAMPLTLEQYASYLDTRDLPWPAAPEVEPPRAKPHLKRLRGIRAVLWNVYGTLLAIPGGELYFEHPQKLQMDVALDKTVQEFKMWGSMTRKPGQPGEYLGQLYSMVLAEQRVGTGGEKHPEVSAERVWEALIKKLLQKEYKFDAGFYGALNEFSPKVGYFFPASLQGPGCYPGAVQALRAVAQAGLTQGLLADGQCFTSVQLQRGLAAQEETARLDELIPPELRFLSCDVRARK